MQFKKNSKIKLAIPTASMPDIIFMLLIFFMTVTVMKTYQGLKVELPDAKKIQKVDVSNAHVATIWVDKDQKIVMNDITVKNVHDLRNLVYQKRVDDPQLVISLKGDKMAKMGVVNDIHQELRKGSALLLNYSAMPSGDY
jgi:biopolymer transport protein ExbD